MRGYGFIVDRQSTDKNPDSLPIGFAKSWDTRSATMMLDLTCAACHTGELQVVRNNKRIAVRIDGGQAMYNVTSTKPGRFGVDVIASMIATELNPLKWYRFSHNVLRDQYNLSEDLHLRRDVFKVVWDLGAQTLLEKRLHLYPEEEGYGRTDALGRIANNVFATNLVSKNYRVANAPVSYPPLWDIWKFDWVQYTASVAQPWAVARDRRAIRPGRRIRQACGSIRGFPYIRADRQPGQDRRSVAILAATAMERGPLWPHGRAPL
jgi:hypothetical protein